MADSKQNYLVRAWEWKGLWADVVLIQIWKIDLKNYWVF